MESTSLSRRAEAPKDVERGGTDAGDVIAKDVEKEWVHSANAGAQCRRDVSVGQVPGW